MLMAVRLSDARGARQRSRVETPYGTCSVSWGADTERLSPESPICAVSFSYRYYGMAMKSMRSIHMYFIEMRSEYASQPPSR